MAFHRIMVHDVLAIFSLVISAFAFCSSVCVLSLCIANCVLSSKIKNDVFRSTLNNK